MRTPTIGELVNLDCAQGMLVEAQRLLQKAGRHRLASKIDATVATVRTARMRAWKAYERANPEES
jgi:hypothetical protein